MVGHDDGAGTGLLCLQGTLHSHDALHDKGRIGCHHDIMQLCHGLGSRRRIQILQERKTRGIHIHGHRKGTGFMHHGHLLLDGFQIPGLHSGNTEAAGLADGLGGRHHDIGIRAVAGEGRNAAFRTGRHQNIIIGNVIQRIPVMEVHRTHGTGKEGIVKVLAEQRNGGINGPVLHQRIHVQPDLLPLVIIPDGRVSDALGAGSRHDIPAGSAVALRAGLADLSHLSTRQLNAFCILHCILLS